MNLTKQFAHESAIRLQQELISAYPPNMNLYGGAMKAKLNAVTAGHNLSELTMLTGTVALIRAITPEGGSPVRMACIPKK